MKILVLGASGMAGHVIALYLREQGHDVDTLSAHNRLDPETYLIDVTNRPQLEELLRQVDYDCIVNCIALLIQPSEEQKDLAVYLNSYLPHYLERRYETTKTRIIHISTDGVFSGQNPPYTEDSDYDGKSFYDRTKALGELRNDKDLTIRTSIIGPNIHAFNQGLFDWFFQQASEIKGYDKVFWNGVTTVELAKGIAQAIAQPIAGIYHFCPTVSISKYALLELLQSTFKRPDLYISPSSETSFDRTLRNTRTDLDFTVSNYEQMLREMKAWIETHQEIYTQYS